MEYSDTATDSASYVDLVQSESLLKERTLARIQHAIKRERSDSVLTNKTKEEEEETHDNLDVREQLFESIPAPFFEITEFQRVIITENTGDHADPDTKFACDGLRTCMDIRDKWISAHPVPPQDSSTFEEDSGSVAGLSSPPRKGNEKKKPDDFRRRANRPYVVFEQSLPTFNDTETLQFKLVHGVMSVIKNDSDDWDNSLYPVRSFEEFVADYLKVR